MAEAFGGLGDGRQAPGLELELVGFLADVDVIVPVAKHAVDELCEFASGGEDRHGGSLVARDSTEVSAEAVLERWSVVAATRSAMAMRLAPRPLCLFFFRGLPPEIGVRGHRCSHDTKLCSLGRY